MILDTSVLVLGVLRTSEERNAVARATSCIERLHAEGARVELTAPAPAESLVQFKPDARKRAWEHLTLEMIVWPFDAPAAQIAAELQAEAFERRRRQAPEERQPRDYLKVDAEIFAVAIHRNADFVLTRDSGMRSMADGRIDVVFMRDYAYGDAPLFAPRDEVPSDED